MRVKQKAVELTKKSEAPFDFWERDKAKMAKKRESASVVRKNEFAREFKATQIPKACSVLIYK